MTHVEVLIIGCGWRGMVLLSHFPTDFITPPKVMMIESRNLIGPGTFASLSAQTNSSPKAFLSAFSRSNPLFQAALSQSEIARLATCDTPVCTSTISQALATIGTCLETVLGANTIRRGCAATRMSQLPDGRYRVETTCGLILATHVVFCTGRTQRISPLLGKWTDKAITAIQFYTTSERLSLHSNASYCIIGGGHSAFQIASMLIEHYPLKETPIIHILHRSPITLYFPDATTATAFESRMQIQAYERKTGICPESGKVNRDSGLRGNAADLYRRILMGAEKRVTLHRVADGFSPKNSDLFDLADLIIQSAEYAPRVIEFTDRRGCVIWDGSGSDRVKYSDDGRVLLDSHADVNIYCVRLNPIPPQRRNAYPELQRPYAKIVSHVTGSHAHAY